jgi:hypothetical protein
MAAVIAHASPALLLPLIEEPKYIVPRSHRKGKKNPRIQL